MPWKMSLWNSDSQMFVFVFQYVVEIKAISVARELYLLEFFYQLNNVMQIYINSLFIVYVTQVFW